MKFSVRRNVFETNSSSTHSITMCSESDYDLWEKGEKVLDYYNHEIIPLPANYKEYDEDDESTSDFEELYTSKRYLEYVEDRYESYSETYTTPSGEKVVAFGYYGEDR